MVLPISPAVPKIPAAFTYAAEPIAAVAGTSRPAAAEYVQDRVTRLTADDRHENFVYEVQLSTSLTVLALVAFRFAPVICAWRRRVIDQAARPLVPPRPAAPNAQLNARREPISAATRAAMAAIPDSAIPPRPQPPRAESARFLTMDERDALEALGAEYYSSRQ